MMSSVLVFPREIPTLKWHHKLCLYFVKLEAHSTGSPIEPVLIKYKNWKGKTYIYKIISLPVRHINCRCVAVEVPNGVKSVPSV